MDLLKEKMIRAAILTLPGIGTQRLRQLIAYFGSAEAALDATMDSFPELKNLSWVQKFIANRAKIDPVALQYTLQQEEIDTVIPGEDHYPCLLAECPDAPPLLFFKGILKPKKEGLAVVGARRATPYGKAAAAFLARSVVELGYVVVSGLARGIDSAAHQSAIDAKGTTWAFLAGGLNKIYPAENKKLARLITEKGALISEYPPGVPAEPGQFPARNRLISGASKGVVVVEAALRSGSLITVDFALEQGREVFAVPGPIFSEQSQGTHQLLKMGAKIASCKEDIVCELACSGTIENSGDNSGQNSLWDDRRDVRGRGDRKDPEDDVLGLLSDIPMHIDRITALCPLSSEEIALILLELQLSGKIIQLPGQNYVLERKT